MAKVARRRMQERDDGEQPERLKQAWQGYVEALLDRNMREADRLLAVIRQYSRPQPRRSAVEQAKFAPRIRSMAMIVGAWQQQRLLEKHGVVQPERTGEQIAEGAVVVERFQRWMAGDDSAGPFLRGRCVARPGMALLRCCHGG